VSPLRSLPPPAKPTRARARCGHKEEATYIFTPLDDEEQALILANTKVSYVRPLFFFPSPLHLTQQQDHNFAPGDGNWTPPHLISGLNDFDAKMYRTRCDRTPHLLLHSPTPSDTNRKTEVTQIERINEALPGARGLGLEQKQGSEKLQMAIWKW